MPILKLKITGKKDVPIPAIEMRSYPRGTFFQVVSETGPHQCVGDIVMRTDEDEWFAVIVHSADKDPQYHGILWGEDQVNPFMVIELDVEIVVES